MESLRPLLFIGSDLDNTQLERMAKTMTPFARPPGTALVTQGEKGATMFYITEGQVSFFRRPANGRLKATAIALQTQFEMEERSNALDAVCGSDSVDAGSTTQILAGKLRPISAAERRNAFSEMSALMALGMMLVFGCWYLGIAAADLMNRDFSASCDIYLLPHPVGTDPLEDPDPSLTKRRKIALGKKLLYAAQLGTCESHAGKSAAGDGADSSGAGAVALDAMGKMDALDHLLKTAAETKVAYPEGRVFEDRDHAKKVGTSCRCA
jgi:hypothetical protein